MNKIPRKEKITKRIKQIETEMAFFALTPIPLP